MFGGGGKDACTAVGVAFGGGVEEDEKDGRDEFIRGPSQPVETRANRRWSYAARREQRNSGTERHCAGLTVPYYPVHCSRFDWVCLSKSYENYVGGGVAGTNHSKSTGSAARGESEKVS